MKEELIKFATNQPMTGQGVVGVFLLLLSVLMGIGMAMYILWIIVRLIQGKGFPESNNGFYPVQNISVVPRVALSEKE